MLNKLYQKWKKLIHLHFISSRAISRLEIYHQDGNTWNQGPKIICSSADPEQAGQGQCLQYQTDTISVQGVSQQLLTDRELLPNSQLLPSSQLLTDSDISFVGFGVDVPLSCPDIPNPG